MFVVKISSHMFTQITEQVGINPLACTWVISDKSVRYKVSTQYMDEIYVSQELFKMFPYISLNHSEFVHYDDIETEAALDKFRRFNQRKRGYYGGSNRPRNNQTLQQHNNNTKVNAKNFNPSTMPQPAKKVTQYKPRK